MRKASLLGLATLVIVAGLVTAGPVTAGAATASTARHDSTAAVRHHKPTPKPTPKPKPKPSPDARTAAAVARSLATTGGGTATWVKARGKAVTAAMFPGEPGIFGDAQRQIDAADLIVVFTADHVSNNYPHPPGYTPPPAVGAGAIAYARTGQVISTSVFVTDDQAATWKAHLASLGTVRRVTVPQ